MLHNFCQGFVKENYLIWRTDVDNRHKSIKHCHENAAEKNKNCECV